MTLQEYDRFFRKTSHKSLTLTFSDGTVLTNSNIVSESLTIEETLCSDDNLYYGACESSCLSIRIAYTEQSFKGLHLQIGVVADSDDTLFVTDADDFYVTDDDDFYANAEIQNFSFGNYLVVSDVPTNDRSYRDLVCYDKMYEIADLDVSAWYKGLTFPMTLKAFRDSFFTHLNVTQETTTLVNDSYNIVGGFSTDELLCRDVLQSICELNGVFGHIDKATGKFLYVDLTAAESLTYPYYVNGTGAYEDYVTDKITGVIAKSADDEVGTLVGTRTNLYTLMGNLCLYGDEGKPAETTALTNLFNKIKNTQFRPFTVQTYGNPMLPLGTSVTFETTYQTVTGYVIKKYLTGIQAMRDTLTATGEKTYPADEARMTSQLTRLKGVSHKLVIDTNRMMSEIYDADTGILSTIDQLSDKVVLKVTSGGRIVQAKLEADPSTGTSFSVKADDIDFIADNVITLSAKNIGIQANNFKIDKTTGLMTCTGGTIGGFTIDTTKIYNGVTSISDTSHDGVYVGTDGIALGKGKFKVTNAGALTATNATITGAITTTSLNIDSLAALSVQEREMSFTHYYWNVSAIASITNFVTQNQLQIDTASRGLYINGITEIGSRLKVGGEVNIEGQCNLKSVVYANSGIYTTSILVNDVTRSTYWNVAGGAYVGSRPASLATALEILSNRIAALGG